MKLDISLEDSLFCNGCPCLEFRTESIDSVRYYGADCTYYEIGLHYSGDRALARHHENVIRPKKCIVENDTEDSESGEEAAPARGAVLPSSEG
jgi:hypothetical protein